MDTPLKYLLAIFGFNSQGLACAIAELAFTDTGEQHKSAVERSESAKASAPVPTSVAIQACRQEDRAMLATPAGIELIAAIARAEGKP